MNFDAFYRALCELGIVISDGYLFSGNYRYGRVGNDALYPENDYSREIPLEEIVSFDMVYGGSEKKEIRINRTNGETLLLKCVELPPRKPYTGLKPNPAGEGFLMPGSLSDLTDAWGSIFPQFRSKCWKEVTTNYIMVDLSLIDEEGLKSLDDPMITRIAAFVQNQLKKIGCRGRQPGKEMIRDVLIAQAELNQRNAFIDMMHKRLWDKQPRLDRLFIDVFGARMKGLSEKDSEAALEDICKCWFLGAVARQHKAIQLDIIPIMIGATGTGKSSAVKWMATCDKFYRDPLDISEKRFVEDTKGGLIVELAEMKATKGADNDYLKAFISRATDHIRLPYDRCASENIRRFVIIGTTNEEEFLTDPTGNRRYFPFTVNPEKSVIGFGEEGFRSSEAEEYIIQVWAEAYHRYMEKEGWNLKSKTIQLAKVAQEASTINNPYVDMLSELVDRLYPLPGERICKMDLEHILESRSIAYGQDASAAATLWMRVPRPEWSGIKTMRINSADHEWMQEPTTSAKCKERIHPPGYKAPEHVKMLGE